MHSLISKKRLINGILLLDKPKEMTSNQALQTVKKLFSASKVGHTGSLDPLATGLLPLCFGEATKFSQFLLNADKTYFVSAFLGIRTNTGDAEGEVIESRPVPNYSTDQLETIISAFRGTISQIPPMFSALKHKGRPLYKLARQGIVVERSPRTVTIHSLRLFESNNTEKNSTVNRILNFEIRCSKGTYIRTLIEDIGEALECGAYVSDLRRLSVANYHAEQMVSLKELQSLSLAECDQKLLSLDSLLNEWPVLKISQAAAYYLYRGQAVLLPNLPKQGLLRLLLQKSGQFIGVGEILEDGRVAPRRLVDLNKLSI
ncbi:MAG: tRNA pseudouridine(55) synthase TruB [Gammaproteobacteria bacterium]|nr:MAG: tRNA pseudouridine(55) synthase TruB [Gammaproteobacteria bacterium]